MEAKIFRLPTVGGLLREHYVEARLHNDDSQHPESVEKVHKLQDELAGNRGTPYYLVIDPKTREQRGVFPGPDLFGDKFAEFLRKALP
jgi:hypothetical protein